MGISVVGVILGGNSNEETHASACTYIAAVVPGDLELPPAVHHHAQGDQITRPFPLLLPLLSGDRRRVLLPCEQRGEQGPQVGGEGVGGAHPLVRACVLFWKWGWGLRHPYWRPIPSIRKIPHMYIPLNQSINQSIDRQRTGQRPHGPGLDRLHLVARKAEDDRLAPHLRLYTDMYVSVMGR